MSCPFSKYSEIFGKQNEGVHSLRFLDVAAIDYFLSILGAIVISFFIGYPLGLYSGLNEGKRSDKLISRFGYLGLAFPVFWLGMILQIVFFSQLNILPLQGRISQNIDINALTSGMFLVDSLIEQNWTVFSNALLHIILPATTLSFSVVGIILRTSRSSLIDTISEPYFNTFKTYGLSKKEIVTKLAYKNTLIPVSTIVGLSYGLMLGGTFLVESIFDWPGLGQFCVLSILECVYSLEHSFTKSCISRKVIVVENSVILVILDCILSSPVSRSSVISVFMYNFLPSLSIIKTSPV